MSEKKTLYFKIIVAVKYVMKCIRTTSSPLHNSMIRVNIKVSSLTMISMRREEKIKGKIFYLNFLSNDFLVTKYFSARRSSIASGL